MKYFRDFRGRCVLLRKYISLLNVYLRSRLYTLEQFDNVAVAHPHAAMRAGNAHRHIIGRAVDINIAAHGINAAQPILPNFYSTQPEDSREYPVTIRKLFSQCLGIDFARGATAHKHRIGGTTTADLGANHMPAAWCAITAGLFTRAISCGGNGKLQ